MDINQWVKEFLYNFSEGTDSKTLLRSKIPKINVLLYKYSFVIEDEKRNEETIDYSIQNLSSDELFFQSPDKFNDPFDCYLGFSQLDAIRELLKQNLSLKKQLTPQNKQAINTFFAEDIEYNNYDMLIEKDNLETILTPFIKFAFQHYKNELSDEHRELLENAFYQVFLSNMETKKLLIKIAKNTLTIHDKKTLIDLFYSNESFREMIKINMKSESTDSIIDIVKNDMLLKTEINPHSIFGEGETTDWQSNFFDIFSTINLKKLNIPNIDIIKETFRNATNEAMENTRRIISQKFRVTCLSEKMDCPLMWSHYANKHYGFCAEYDFTPSTPWVYRKYPDLALAQAFLFPVHYSKDRPLISNTLFNAKTMIKLMKTKTLPQETMIKILLGLLYKSEEWAYEREWRILLFSEGESTMKLPSPRRIFIGANMGEIAKEKIMSVAKLKGIPVYQMFLAKDKYSFDFYKIKEQE